MNNDELVGIIQKPQFDTSIFSQGVAVHLKYYNSSQGKSGNGLIIKATPLQLNVAVLRDTTTSRHFEHHDEDGTTASIMHTAVRIDDVTNGNIKITILK